MLAGTGGVRKLRWQTGKGGKGKSGGLRILYHYSNDILVLLIILYAKNIKENISNREKNQLSKLLP
ncbi:hypothetical protein TUM19329_10160 [Legionella antarctica]|uniref:Toxin HigB-2 n=1 Tax=Legionella antarctica TaxID=2708020 RepID=A0A6F8T1W8_9GAMM|nr:hypothetical protein TUM19329_10160 [Legionella antarctica]